DLNGNATGGYAMTPISIGSGIAVDNGGDAGPVASGVTKTAAVNIGDVDAFTISAKAGGTLMATVGETTLNSPLTPFIELFGPTGTRLTYNYGPSGTTISSYNLPVTGTYVI